MQYITDQTCDQRKVGRSSLWHAKTLAKLPVFSKEDADHICRPTLCLGIGFILFPQLGHAQLSDPSSESARQLKAWAEWDSSMCCATWGKHPDLALQQLVFPHLQALEMQHA